MTMRADCSFSVLLFAGIAATSACKRENASTAPNQNSPVAIATTTPDARTADGTPRDSVRETPVLQSDAANDASTVDGPIAAPPEEIIPNRFGAGLGLTGTGNAGIGEGTRTVGLADIGTIGSHGANGTAGGYAGGRIIGLGRGRNPSVRPGTPIVAGSLSSELIRRVTLRNVMQLRFCYEQGLLQNPALAGPIVIRYIIGATGDVMGATVAESNLAVPLVGQCFVAAVRRWRFPAAPGIVSVTAPFALMTM